MKKKRFKFKYIFYVMLLCYVGYTLVSQQMTINRMRDDILKYDQQNKKIEDANQYLKDQIEFAKTDEYKEKMAREKIGLIKPGETVYIINKEK